MESDQEAYFQDDNINNFHDDDSDEELFEDDTNNVSKIIEDLEKDENGKDEDEVEPEPEKNTNGTSTEKSIGIFTNGPIIYFTQMLYKNYSLFYRCCKTFGRNKSS